MKQNFFKMQAQGNDFIFFDFLESANPPGDFDKIALKLCDRNFGIGADGIVLLRKDENCDAFMMIFNADGSEAEMCGSALRCLGNYLQTKKNIRKSEIRTISGMKYTEIVPEGIKADLGKPHFIEPDLKKISGLNGYLVSMGNPHFVVFGEDLQNDLIEKLGKQIEKSYPGGINVEFVKISDESHIRVIFWERGSGRTLACGTGSCAAVFAGIKKNLLSSKVEVLVPGGKVSVEFHKNRIFLIGKTEMVFSGEIEI